MIIGDTTSSNLEWSTNVEVCVCVFVACQSYVLDGNEIHNNHNNGIEDKYRHIQAAGQKKISFWFSWFFLFLPSASRHFFFSHSILRPDDSRVNIPWRAACLYSQMSYMNAMQWLLQRKMEKEPQQQQTEKKKKKKKSIYHHRIVRTYRTRNGYESFSSPHNSTIIIIIILISNGLESNEYCEYVNGSVGCSCRRTHKRIGKRKRVSDSGREREGERKAVKNRHSKDSTQLTNTA